MQLAIIIRMYRETELLVGIIDTGGETAVGSDLWRVARMTRQGQDEVTSAKNERTSIVLENGGYTFIMVGTNSWICSRYNGVEGSCSVSVQSRAYDY